MKITEKQLDSLLSIGTEAGEILLQYYKGESLDIRNKSDESPVTAADEHADRFIVDKLKHSFPDVPIITEETPLPDYEVRKNWKNFFLVDPLDGTKEFIKKNDQFTVNIGLISNGEPLASVLGAPALGLVFIAAKGIGSFEWNLKTNIKTRLIYKPPIEGCCVKVAESKSHRFQNDRIDQSFLEKYSERESVLVGSSLKFCLLAQARAHFYVRTSHCWEWDTAAGDAVYRYATEDLSKVNPSKLTYQNKDIKKYGFIVGGTEGLELEKSSLS